MTTVKVPVQKFLDGIHPWQHDVLRAFDHGTARFFMLVWHRRARKTTLDVNLLIREAMRNERSVYTYVGPTYRQAKAITWRDPNMLFRYLPDKKLFPWTKNESELFIEFHNGSLLQIKGADDPDSLRGLDSRGVVFDEWALQKENIWLEIFRPIIAQDPTRWAVFSFTPKGENHAAAMWRDREGDDWYKSILPASVSGLVPAGELAKAKAEMPLSLYNQEFECQFIGEEERTLITSAMLAGLQGVTRVSPMDKTLVACDPATGGDECVILVFHNGDVIDQVVLHERNSMIVSGHLHNVALRHKTKNIIIDEIGVGKGIYDDLRLKGFEVQGFNSSSKSVDTNRFYNKRAEAWWYVAEQVKAHNVGYPEDNETRRQIVATRFRIVNSNGQVRVDPKDDTKKLLGHSPDRADAWIMGVYGLQYISSHRTKDVWERSRDRHQRVSAMAG